MCVVECNMKWNERLTFVSSCEGSIYGGWTRATLKKSNLFPVKTLNPRRRRLALVSCLTEKRKSSSQSVVGEPSVFCYGGASAFGVEITRRFTEGGNGVVSVDSAQGSSECTESVCFPPGATCKAQVDIAVRTLEKSGLANHRFGLMVNASLGWTTGGIMDDNLFDSVDFMHRSNVESSLVLAKLATRFLAPGGMLVFMGSAVALTPTPDMIAYSLAKAAIHQLVMDLSQEVGRALPRDSSVIGFVPVVLDTPFHRAENNGVAGDDWTPCDVIAEKLWEWSTQVSKKRPKNGSLISVTTHTVESERGWREQRTLFRTIKTDNFVQTNLL
jgi:NAD(P)-dependent dehydrogenase (short-subunit alcohol dehydrogenase family)